MFANFRINTLRIVLFGNTLKRIGVGGLRGANEISVFHCQFSIILSHYLKGGKRVIKPLKRTRKCAVCYGQDFARGYHLFATFSPNLRYELS